MEVDYLIIGHGLAGVNVSEHLAKACKRFVVISEEKENSSSKIAAGLYNPITGRKMKETWMADKLFPYLIEFYRGLEKSLNEEFLHHKPIFRPFFSVEDQNEWISSSSSSSRFVSQTITNPRFSDFIHDEYGGILLNHSGYLDVKKMLSAHRKHLLEKEQLILNRFEAKKLQIEKEGVSYDQIKAKNIIFCDGPLSKNPFFDWVPTAPVKGEILHIKTAKPLPEDVIFNRGVFIVKQTAQNFYRVGATYEWQKLDFEPTEKARIQLTEKLRTLLKTPFQIVDQVAGIRPASKDRRPLIGQHPQFKNIYLFNGLGTKGVSLAPYFAKHFVDTLISTEILNNEVDISRYYPLYSSAYESKPA